MDIKNIVFQYDKVIFLAPNDIQELLHQYNACEIDATAIDYDPKFNHKQHYYNKDFVFDEVDLRADLIVHMNVEKTYPVELPEGGDVILRGDNEEHNGDCCPITSCDQMIEMYKLKTVWQKSEQDGHFFVYGCR